MVICAHYDSGQLEIELHYRMEETLEFSRRYASSMVQPLFRQVAVNDVNEAIIWTKSSFEDDTAAESAKKLRLRQFLLCVSRLCKLGCDRDGRVEYG